jgi:hypothetical protein
VTADRWYPSSKSCSCCGVIKPTLDLAERMFRCDDCGFAAGRDHNAALNLAGLAASSAVSACGEARSGARLRPRVKLASAKQEESSYLREAASWRSGEIIRVFGAVSCARSRPPPLPVTWPLKGTRGLDRTAAGDPHIEGRWASKDVLVPPIVPASRTVPGRCVQAPPNPHKAAPAASVIDPPADARCRHCRV